MRTQLRHRWPIALLVVVSFSAVLARLAQAPLYPRYTASECEAAYASARTIADTNRADLHPYHPKRGVGDHRCGEVRGARVSAARAPNAPWPPDHR